MRQVIWQKLSFDFPIDEEPTLEHEHEDNGYNDTKFMPFRMLSQPKSFAALTNMGQLPNDFNFWIGHCNFNVSESAAFIVGRWPGVEFFRVTSRYRFVISIGLAFTPSLVMSEIQKALCAEPYSMIDIDNEVKLSAQKIITSHKHKACVLYIAQNGEIDYKIANRQEDLKEAVLLYEAAKAKFGGYVIKSWEDFGVLDNTG